MTVSSGIYISMLDENVWNNVFNIQNKLFTFNLCKMSDDDQVRSNFDHSLSRIASTPKIFSHDHFREGEK